MRQLLAEVPRGQGEKALSIARRHQGVNLARLEGESAGGAVDLVLIHVSNSRIAALLEDLQDLPDLRVTLLPHGVLALRPPREDTPRQIAEVEPRSPLEVFLAGLQSVGSWKSFLTYAALAGIVVFIGLFTNRVLLLVEAGLIAPFAGPAMNSALAAARGDGPLLARSLLRYAVSLALAAAEVRAAVRESGLGWPVKADVHFASGEAPGPPPLLAEVYVQRAAGVAAPREEVRERLARAIQSRLLRKGFHVTPLPAVTVIDPPPGEAEGRGRR